MNSVQKIITKLFKIETNNTNSKELGILKEELEQTRTLNKALNDQIQLYQARIRDSENTLGEYKNLLTGKETLLKELKEEIIRLSKLKGEEKITPVINQNLGYRKSLIMTRLNKTKMAKAKELLEASNLTSRSQLWKLLRELEQEQRIIIQGEGNTKYIILNEELKHNEDEQNEQWKHTIIRTYLKLNKTN